MKQRRVDFSLLPPPPPSERGLNSREGKGDRAFAPATERPAAAALYGPYSSSVSLSKLFIITGHMHIVLYLRCKKAGEGGSDAGAVNAM